MAKDTNNKQDEKLQNGADTHFVDGYAGRTDECVAAYGFGRIQRRRHRRSGHRRYFRVGYPRQRKNDIRRNKQPLQKGGGSRLRFP